MELETPPQPLVSATTPVPPQNPQPVEKKSKKNFLLLLLIISVCIISGGIYIFQNYRKQLPKTTSNQVSEKKQTTSTKENLNPDSGNLYQDIKTRMKEVLQ